MARLTEVGIFPDNYKSGSPLPINSKKISQLQDWLFSLWGRNLPPLPFCYHLSGQGSVTFAEGNLLVER